MNKGLSRGERIGCVVAIALLLTAIVALVYTWRWENVTYRQTVPEAVLYDSHSENAVKSQQVYEWGVDEIDYLISQGFDIPIHSIAVVGVMEADGWTVITSEPTKYDITLARYLRPKEAAVRKVAAHEAAHVLMDVKGVPQSEVTADAFAACFGSPMAREYALTWGREKNPDCTVIGELLKGAK